MKAFRKISKLKYSYAVYLCELFYKAPKQCLIRKPLNMVFIEENLTSLASFDREEVSLSSCGIRSGVKYLFHNQIHV